MSSFVTYAQNFEDLMLWRALRQVDNGFYIDVGAADPDEDSVTRAFYDRGWRGINIEPSPEHFDTLRAVRPRDVTLQCLVGAQSGEGVFYHFPDTGLSTTVETFAGRHIAEGRIEETLAIPILTLAEICRQYAPDAIHFLKIDVEGAEGNVLRGADLGAFRPWIIVIEATEPGSQVESWSGWEGLLVSASYQFVWFDGLNRFYVAQEHFDALRHAFLTPPNVFDLWVQPRGKQKAALNFASERIAHLESELEAARHTSAIAQSELGRVRSDLDRIHATMMSERAEAERLRDVSTRQSQELLQAQDALAQATETSTRQGQELLQARDGLARAHGTLVRQSQELVEAHAELARLKDDVSVLSQRLAVQHELREQAETRLSAVYQSRSWKAAAPLRGMGRLFRGQPVLPRLGQILRVIFHRLIRLIIRLPGGRTAKSIVRRLVPGMYGAIYNRYRSGQSVSASLPSEMNAEAPSAPTSHSSVPEVTGITAEEARILLRLSARSHRL